MIFLKHTHTLPENISRLINRLKEEKKINKSAFVAQAIFEKAEREYPDLTKRSN